MYNNLTYFIIRIQKHSQEIRPACAHGVLLDTPRLDVLFFFFFQAEDGIRDLTVTGVQTCALPISPGPSTSSTRSVARPRGARRSISLPATRSDSGKAVPRSRVPSWAWEATCTITASASS